MMALLFLILLAAATFHFVWESIIAPSLRLQLRYRIFEQRDRLRMLKVTRHDELSQEAFCSLHDSVNTAVRLLPSIGLTTLMEAGHAVESDPELREYIEKRRELLNHCPVQEVREIHQATTAAVSSAFAINSLCLTLWLLPIVLSLAIIRWTTRRIAELMLIPAGQIDRLVSLQSRALLPS